MCFEIDKAARPWTKNYVWKVVLRRTNARGRVTFTSPQYGGIEYKIGATRQIKRDDRITNIAKNRTVAGIYVLRTVQAAREYLTEWGFRRSQYRIIKLAVDPKDFLFASC